jgi:integrase
VVLESKSTDRELSKGEIAAIMEACDTGTRIGKRDADVIALMYAAALRPTEL